MSKEYGPLYIIALFYVRYLFFVLNLDVCFIRYVV